MAALFMVPSNHVLSRGIALPGATATLYETGTTTPVAFYSDEALSVSLGSTITANGAGVFPAAYQDSSTAFRLILKDKTGAEIEGGDIDPFYFGSIQLPDEIRSQLGVASVMDAAYGAAGNGTADDTAAFTAAFAANSKVHIPAGTFIVSSISIPANTVVTTAGHDTIIKQKSGTAHTTRLIKITGSNVVLGDLAVEGQLNQSGDTTDEQNHGVFIALESTATASISNVTVGNIKGTNIRGDVVYIGTHPTATTNGYRISGVSVGHVIGSNVYRNVVSVTGGSDISIESVTGTAVGLYAFDAEPDDGNGPITGLRVGYIKGRNCAFVGYDATDWVEAWVGHMDLDQGYTTASTPAYSTTAYKKALQFRNIKSLRVERFYANGHAEEAIYVVGGNAITRQSLSFGHVEIPSSNSTPTATGAYIITGTACQTTIDTLNVTTTNAAHAVFHTCGNLTVGAAQVSMLTGSYYMRSCDDCTTGVLNMSTNGAGNGGIVMLSGTRCQVNGGTQVGDIFYSFSTRCSASGINATFNNYDNSGTENIYLNSRVAGIYFILFRSGVATIEAAGNLLASGKTGYLTGVGAGGTVTQATSKTTGVTLNKITGQITMNNAALAAGAKVSFVVTNSTVGATDIITANVLSGGTANAYRAAVTAVAAGSFTVTVENITAGSLSEAPVIGFLVSQGAAT